MYRIYLILNMKKPLLVFNDKGIYCSEADVYIDPWRPVKKAIITHGHADHSRYGNEKYITHHDNIPIVKHRLGDVRISGYNYNQSFEINGVKFSFHPAGHVIGSSQIRVEHKGEVWVATGDYKTEDDGVCQPFEPVKCHSFITECTFGLPVFKWQPQDEVFSDINRWWKENQDQNMTSIILVYSLGKAQRVLKYLNTHIGKIYTHGAIENLTEVLRTYNDFPQTHRITRDTTKSELQGNIVLAPPSAHGTTWMRKMVPYVTASASGWMSTRGARRRRAIDKGFVLSDHADWDGLLSAIKSTGCEKVICTHGYTDIFSRYLKTMGYDAKTEQTQYEEDED